jgi:hypothetical protein
MTDLEISKALALAIGHSKAHVSVLGETPAVWVQTIPRMAWSIRVFDYRDWDIIGPIAEKFDCFPVQDREPLGRRSLCVRRHPAEGHRVGCDWSGEMKALLQQTKFLTGETK